jgi:hypothetical protein
MTRNILFLPTNGDSPTLVDFDELNEPNPYFAAGDLIGEDESRAYCAMVRTPFENFHLFVNEEGSLLGLPIHPRASFRLYPGPLLGDIVVMKTHLEYSEEGPDHVIDHMPASQANKILVLCGYGDVDKLKDD